ncbi:MAG: hypothetical protein K0R94_243 [Burkholderiales bacterium]|jgi:hypothetical protein|nr:hypothetical protein [Burkholderiales bacterium]
MNKPKAILSLIFFSICCSSYVEARKAQCYRDTNKKYICCEKKSTIWFKMDSYASWVSDTVCPEGNSLEKSSWSEANVCDYNASMHNSDMKNIIQGCGSSGGVVIDNKLEHVCIFLYDKSEGKYVYKFLAWSNIKGSGEVYTSENIMTNLDTQSNIEKKNSFPGLLNHDIGTQYGWTSSDGNYYKVARKLYSDSKLWEIYKNGELLSYEAKCGLYSDIVAAGANQDTWNSKAVFDKLSNYNNY